MQLKLKFRVRLSLFHLELAIDHNLDVGEFMMKKYQQFISLVLLAIAANPTFAADAAAGKAKAALCASCHGQNGISMLPQNPNLAGQKELYLVNALKAYKAQTRKEPTMNAMAAPLSDTDIANLAAYYSSLKP